MTSSYSLRATVTPLRLLLILAQAPIPLEDGSEVHNTVDIYNDKGL